MEWHDYSHPVLGECKRRFSGPNNKGDTYAVILKSKPIVIGGLDIAFPELELMLRNAEEPTEQEISEVTAVLNLSKEQKLEVEESVFRQYADDIYPTYLEIYSNDYGMEKNEIDKLLPALESPRQIWRLFGDPRGVSYYPPNNIQLSYRCNFDDEHDLNLSFSNGKLVEVWTE